MRREEWLQRFSLHVADGSASVRLFIKDLDDGQVLARLVTSMYHSNSPGHTGDSGPRSAPGKGGRFDTAPCKLLVTENFIGVPCSARRVARRSAHVHSGYSG